ncbi:hypothetical protein ACVILL_007464 [Bradyrhizobium sp. USDA 3364]
METNPATLTSRGERPNTLRKATKPEALTIRKPNGGHGQRSIKKRMVARRADPAEVPRKTIRHRVKVENSAGRHQLVGRQLNVPGQPKRPRELANAAQREQASRVLCNACSDSSWTEVHFGRRTINSSTTCVSRSSHYPRVRARPENSSPGPQAGQHPPNADACERVAQVRVDETSVTGAFALAHRQHRIWRKS